MVVTHWRLDEQVASQSGDAADGDQVPTNHGRQSLSETYYRDAHVQIFVDGTVPWLLARLDSDDFLGTF